MANKVSAPFEAVNFLYKAVNFINGKGTEGGYHAEGIFSGYGETSSIDDNADSFAVVAMGSESPYSIDNARSTTTLNQASSFVPK